MMVCVCLLGTVKTDVCIAIRTLLAISNSPNLLKFNHFISKHELFLHVVIENATFPYIIMK